MNRSEQRAYLAELSGELMSGCQCRAHDGTVLYTPDTVSSYNALWGRDFAYMAEYAPEFMPLEHLLGGIGYLVRHARADGWIPDRVGGDGRAVYAAGAASRPVGEANLDTAPFLAIAMEAAFARMTPDDIRRRLAEWAPAVLKAYRLVPTGEGGLVSNPEDKPHSPYGFTDIVCKTGALFFESLLYWRGARMMAARLEQCGLPDASWYAAAADRVETAIGALWDERAGLFMAASGLCRQPDIWGNVYAIAIGFPIGERRRRSIEDYMAAHFDEVVYKGQVRHLPAGQHWQRLLIDEQPGHYQNGAFWATATGWMVFALRPRYPALADRMIADAIECFRREGVFECVNRGYQKLDRFVVSATNVYGALRER
ncbi:MAG: hypothetical protein GX558_11115 [Clostridiales bacterium]|nr:hypothetical protein [Clostridiales bacterium]